MITTVTIGEKHLQKIIKEELKKAIYTTKSAKVLKEADVSDDVSKKSHEISAAASTLQDSIETFENENLPEIPTELATALKTAKDILGNMSDNPGQYKGGSTTQSIPTQKQNKVYQKQRV